VGIDDKFMKQLAVNVKSRTSAFLVLVKHVTVDKVLEPWLRRDASHPVRT